MIALVASMAFAQDEAALESLDSTTFRPSIGGRAAWWTTEAGTADAGGAGRMVAGYQRDPLVARTGDTTVSVLQDVVAFDLLASYTWKQLRVGFDVPVVAYAGSDTLDSVTGLGNTALEVHGIALPTGGDAPVGLAGQARLILPGTLAGPIGGETVSGEILGIIDRDLGPALIAANVGVRIGQDSELPNVQVGDAALYRIGAGFDLVPDQGGLSLDLGGQVALGDPANVAANPIEAIGGGWARVAPEFVVRAGVGRALTPGVGAPNVRALLSLGLERAPDDDADDDGIVDKLDRCRDIPEDRDGFEDEDGCPDDRTQVRVLVVDGTNQPIAGATIEMCGKPARPGEVVLLPAGPCEIAVGAEGFDADRHVLSVIDGPPMEVVRALVATPPPVGHLSLVVTDLKTNPIDASWSVGRGGEHAAPGGVAKVELEPGTWTLRVTSDGFMPTSVPLEIRPSETVEVNVQLRPVKVKVTREKVEIADVIYFDTGKATIQSRSFGLLDDVAAVLGAYPEIVSVRIEGHTDSRGSDTSNLTLSQNRAKSVTDYLVSKGVGASRLSSEGYGESRPVDPAQNSAAWEKNRRVEFVITGWKTAE